MANTKKDMHATAHSAPHGANVLERRITGTVKWYSLRRRYGFIQRDDGGKDIFVHQTAISKSRMVKVYLRTLRNGENVEFDIVRGNKGPQAASVTGPDGQEVRGSPHYMFQFYSFRKMVAERHHPDERTTSPKKPRKQIAKPLRKDKKADCVNASGSLPTGQVHTTDEPTVDAASKTEEDVTTGDVPAAGVEENPEGALNNSFYETCSESEHETSQMPIETTPEKDVEKPPEMAPKAVEKTPQKPIDTTHEKAAEETSEKSIETSDMAVKKSPEKPVQEDCEEPKPTVVSPQNNNTGKGTLVIDMDDLSSADEADENCNPSDELNALLRKLTVENAPSVAQLEDLASVDEMTAK